MNIKKIILNPKSHIVFLMLLIIIVALFWQPQHFDDGSNYQRFAEKIVDEGRIDLSIQGFHGSDWIIAIVYFITGWQYSAYLVDLLAAILVVLLVYLVVKELYGKEFLAVVASYIYTLMAFDIFNFIRGGHLPLHFLTALLALYLLLKNKNYSWIVLGISYITRPFSVTLAPFYIYKKKYKQLLLSFIFPLVYVTAQYMQAGQVIIGQHPDLTAQKLFDLKRFFLNIIYAIQNYFSVHNFSPVNPLYPSDLIHISPIITVLAVIGVLYYKKYFASKKLFYTFVAFALFSFLLPASFFWMDIHYFAMFNFALIFLALPVISDYKRLIPIIAFTSSYQYFYLYLTYQEFFSFAYIVFIIPLSILIVSLLYVYYQRQKL